MRKLIYVPIIHTEADLGSMAEFLKKEYKRRYNQKKWQAHTKAVEEMWNGIREKIVRLNQDWQRVRIYQDGLPVCGRELEIVTDLAKMGSVNHQIVVDSVRRGGKLEGTEYSKFLLEEYDTLQKVAHAKNDRQRKNLINEYNRGSSELLIKRDRFIANRIDQTLGKREIGILFIGILHAVDKFLPADIEVKYLIHRLPFDKGLRYKEKVK
ncbi:MAG: hypothetical protein ABIL68_06575 [bacterium]